MAYQLPFTVMVRVATTKLRNGTSDLEPAKVWPQAGFMGIEYLSRSMMIEVQGAIQRFILSTSSTPLPHALCLDRARWIKSTLPIMSSHSHTFDIGETEIFTNQNSVVYVGHSHGGEVGAIALPLLENMSSPVSAVPEVVALP